MSLLEKEEQQLKDDMIRAERARKALAAKQLLDNPDVSRLLNTMMQEHYEAFIRLPLNATLDDYRILHHSFLAVKRLKDNLEDWVKQHVITEQLDQQVDQVKPNDRNYDSKI